MQQSNRELWSAFLAIIAITFLYLFMVINLGEIPGASDLFGHGIGIVGFTFMLMTETLYSLRKRRRTAMKKCQAGFNSIFTHGGPLYWFYCMLRGSSMVWRVW
jgi:hypothetical protein